MRTLLFTPMWLGEPARIERHKRWQNYYKDLRDLKIDNWLLVDNASPPVDFKIQGIVMKFDRFLPRLSQNAYPYWYRAFRRALEFSMDFEYSKIIHIDTDAYILSHRLCDFLNTREIGWTSLWCETYGFPESAIQVICKDQFEKAYEFFTEGFLEYYPNDIAENRIPFTHVERGFVGDRYGEKIIDGRRQEQTPTMDYYCQAELGTTFHYAG